MFSSLTALSWISWCIIPYLFVAAITEIFLLLAAETVTYSDAPCLDCPIFDPVTTLKPTSSRNTKFSCSVSYSARLKSIA